MYVYNLNEIENKSDEQLIQKLKESWDYSDHQKLELIGQLTEISQFDKESFFIIENLQSINENRSIRYPLRSANLNENSVYVGPLLKKYKDKFKNKAWVKCQVELSPRYERDKRKNPFALMAIKETLTLLQEIPKGLLDVRKEATSEGINFIEKWVIDFHYDKNKEKILQESEFLREELDKQVLTIKNELASLSEKQIVLVKKLKNKQDTFKEVSIKLKSAQDSLDFEEKKLDQLKIKSEHTLSTLNNFISNKVNMLQELDLISKEEVEHLLGSKELTKIKDGYIFEDIFSSDITKAMSFIQAYMFNAGSIYPKKILEDFFALLNTHDLIVLAGDSGSGKTNIIKSFAKAISGKAIIIPVKPNWTSAEDLLGYYNPLEKKYLSTPFLDALLEASYHPDTPYFICLDEMNLARIEYYFADFLSLMEERSSIPEISLYSDNESAHLVSEVKNFLALIDETKLKLEKHNVVNFLDLLRDEDINRKLHELCGFKEGDSLLKYHAHLRKILNSYLSTPSKLKIPSNVRIIGTINVDETTHYLSPKILDRAHVLRFKSPLLMDWNGFVAQRFKR